MTDKQIRELCKVLDLHSVQYKVEGEEVKALCTYTIDDIPSFEWEAVTLDTVADFLNY